MHDYQRKITQLQQEMGLSQTDIANAIGASRQAISKYEWAEAMPSVDMAARNADCFEVTIDYLMVKNHQLQTTLNAIRKNAYFASVRYDDIRTARIKKFP